MPSQKQDWLEISPYSLLPSATKLPDNTSQGEREGAGRARLHQKHGKMIQSLVVQAPALSN
jgi:hypothetical protein